MTYSTVTDKGFCKHKNGNNIVLCAGYRFDSDAAGCRSKCTSYGPCVGYIVGNSPGLTHCYLIPSEENCPQEFDLDRPTWSSLAKTSDDLVEDVRGASDHSCYSKRKGLSIILHDIDLISH